MSLRYSTLLVVPVFFLLACNGRSDDPVNKFSDPVIVRIADLKDRRLADSLYPFFNHENALYRLEAVQAFGSIQETMDIDKIGKLLMMDADAGVRRAAAFALGQIQHPSCERLLLGALVKEKIPENTFTILEAYGKTTGRWKLEPAPFMDDTTKSAGLAWSLYRSGLRGKTDSVSNGVAKRLLNSALSLSTRLGASHYFARGAADFNDAEEILIATATGDTSAEVRMAAALALGKIGTDSSLSTLKKIVRGEKDARVVVNAVRALRSFPFDNVEAALYECLGHRDLHAGIAASEVIRDMVSGDNWIHVSNHTNRTTEWRIIANLYEGALRAGRHEHLALEIRDRYAAQGDPYVKSALLASLKHYPASCTFVEAELLNADTAIIRSTAAATLVAMNYSENFSRQYRNRFAGMYSKILQATDDPAVIGIIAGALADSVLGYRDLIRDYGFLTEAREKLELPEHIEAMQPLEAAIAYFERSATPEVRNEFNHPIDWQLVKRIPDDLRVTIKTTRGQIVVRLFVNEAPGSVANFIALAQRDYFDNKFFHRVVPNFVIQAGCRRGDGWGSEDYSIRSEFSQRRYTAGSVGMASAGKDTEGTQWFITHSPTPHLDGRYTIFGEVVDGLKVAAFMQVGDRITDIEVGNFNAQ